METDEQPAASPAQSAPAAPAAATAPAAPIKVTRKQYDQVKVRPATIMNSWPVPSIAVNGAAQHCRALIALSVNASCQGCCAEPAGADVCPLT